MAWFDEVSGEITRVPIHGKRIWLRAECDFVRNQATFQYSSDGKAFATIGLPHTMAYGLITFQGVRYSLFSYNTQPGSEGGYADFDAMEVKEGTARPIPYGKRIELWTQDGNAKLAFGKAGTVTVVDRGLGRVGLKTDGGFVSVDVDRNVSLRTGAPRELEAFQWIETFAGEVTLMSLATHRYLRLNPAEGKVRADSPGPRPDGRDGVRFRWRVR
jgi:hypothetical protein